VRLQQGDVIKRPGPWGTNHVGLFGGTDFLGRGWVIHNAKDDCVKWEDLETFAAGSMVSLVRRAANAQEGFAVVSRAASLSGTKFDLINFNCEHFVTYALAGEAVSRQLRGVVVGFAILAGIGVLARTRVSA